MVLHRQILFNVAIAIIAEAILMQISAEQVAQGCCQVLVTVFWHIDARTVVASPSFLGSSEGMLSTPGDFPAIRLRTAYSTYSLNKGRLSTSCVGVWSLWSRLVSGWSL